MEKAKNRVCKLGARRRQIPQSGKQREWTGHPEDNPGRSNRGVFEVPGGKEEEAGPEEVLKETRLKPFLIRQNTSAYRFEKPRKPLTE